MRLFHGSLFLSLSALLAGCVSTDAERASLAASPEQAMKQAQLDPIMREGIAQAVENTHPMTRLLANNVLVAEISNERSETSELDRSKYVAYYCVNVTIERPLLDWHRVFIVHPMHENGRAVYRVKWNEKDTLKSCGANVMPFPELKSLYEGAVHGGVRS